MSVPFVGEIRMFAGNFAPSGWALCDGQLLAISENEQLFSLFGTTYGGDGRVSFGLPDLRGRIPIHAGAGPMLTSRKVGDMGGMEMVSLTRSHLPPHSHTFNAVNIDATETSPGEDETLANSIGYDAYVSSEGVVSMAPSNVSSIGDSLSHENEMPYLCVNFIVALVGLYPSRS